MEQQDFNVVFKFAAYRRDGKTRCTYRVIRTLDDRFIIQGYGSAMKQWFNEYIDIVWFKSLDELFRSKEFRILFTEI